MKRYDICVIGGGPSGYAAAMRSVDFKRNVILIEQSTIGGAGITNGALSSKTWWEVARQISVMRTRAKALNLEVPKINFEEIKADVRMAVEYRKKLLMDHIERINGLQEDILRFEIGKARLISRNEVEISKADGSIETIHADNIVLATGSRPRKLPDIPIDEKTILTSDGIESLPDFPESIVIEVAAFYGD